MIEFLHEYQGYMYFFATVFLTVMLYAYIYFLYTDKKRGIDYEKYSDLALNDEIDDELVDATYKSEEKKDSKKN